MEMKPFEKKIWLASPTMHGEEQKYVNLAFEQNWITTAGEKVNEVERITADKVRKWSTQAREAAPWYQREELGYNYRMP